MDLSRLRYLPSHEWADVQADVITVGITQYAVDQLTDVTHLELAKVGATLTAGKRFGEIESVKAVFDLNAPFSGEVIEVNDKVKADPSLINADCYGKGWMLKLRPTAEATDITMDFAAYEKQLASEAH